MDEEIVEDLWLFVTLQCSSTTLKRFGTAHPLWVSARLGGGEQSSRSVIALHDGIVFGPYVWRIGWRALEEEWIAITHNWPTIRAMVHVGYPGNLFDTTALRFPDEPVPDELQPYYAIFAAQRGNWTWIRDTTDPDDVAAFFFEVDTAGSLAASPWLDRQLDQQIDNELQTLDEYYDQEETIACDSRLAWHAQLEKQRRMTAEDPVDSWQEAIDWVHDQDDPELNPNRFPDPLSDDNLGTWELEEQAQGEAEILASEAELEDMIRKGEEWAAEIDAQRKKTVTEEQAPDETEDWDWPDDLPF